jgi:hypothetical protein
LADGPEALSSAELLGILLGIGTKEQTAVELVQQEISESGGSSVCMGLGYKPKNTKPYGLCFSAVLGSGPSEVRFEGL